MKYELIDIRDYVFKLAEIIAEVLRVEVEIVDKDLIRIAGTGRYRNKDCISIVKESFVYRKVLSSGKKMVIENPGFHKLCNDCPKKNSCIEKFECCTPIAVDGEVIGVISLICFTECQKKIIIDKFKEYYDFLDRMSELISAKVKENIATFEKINKAIYEATENDKRIGFSSIIGDSIEIQNLKLEAKKIARGNATILITGESGTGKELFARAIHYDSKRSDKPFIAINCGAIPDALLESELFGYSPGAFSGANKNGKIGKFQLANGGSIFLDEIGDMPLHLQVKILRVLQEKVVIPIGSNKPISTDVRLISATNKNLEEMVKNHEFREDLYYRLNVIPIEIPPLRKRKDDIPILINYFLKKYSNYYKVENVNITDAAMEKLQQYNWKGNIRELENAVEYMINLLQSDKIIKLEHLPRNIRNYTPNYEVIEEFNLEQIEKQTIIKALNKCGNNTEDKKNTAKLLGISLSTLYRKMGKYNIK